MPKKTTVLIIILTIITAALLYLALKAEEKPRSLPSLPAIKKAPPTKMVEKSAVISFSPRILSVNSGVAAADIMVDSAGKPITGVQIELVFDPQVLQNVKITPSQGATSFFGTEKESIVLRNGITTQGRISYIIAVQPRMSGKVGNASIGTLSFTTSQAHPSSTTVQFADKTMVTTEGEVESVLKGTTPLTITFSSSSSPSGR